MQITFKTISQVTFQIEVDASLTVGELKTKVATDRGEDDFPVEGMKLIYNGKILDDAQTVEEVKIDATKFIVVMVGRKKPAPTATVAVSEPTAVSGAVPTTTSSTTAPPSATTPTTQPATETTAVQPAAQQPPAPAPAAAQPEPLTAEQEETVQAICGMGYTRERVIRALRVAFFNGDRAVEYLCTGLPDEEELAAAQEEGEADESAEAVHGLEFLRQLPQFDQLRELVQSNPAILPQIIQQIAQSNPALMEAIQNNQEQFVNLLNAPNTEGAAHGAVPTGGTATRQPNQPNSVAIEVTASERDTINRLKSMGFPEQLVIEAFFACDKNEDLAVNYILARMDEAADELDAAESHGQGGGS